MFGPARGARSGNVENREPMSEGFFTRSDWRAGKRRRTQPRLRAYGGRKEAPLGLLAAGRLAGLHTNTARRCTATANSTGRTCRRVAVSGANVCMVHGGALTLKRNRPYVATGHGQRIMAERALGGDRPDRRTK
jgi:hypothetical protein